jgi:NADH-quinone oxidoreductase subunit E
MLPTPLTDALREKIAAAAHPRELVVDVMLALQAQVGYLSDEAVAAAAELLSMTPLEIDELATFYTFVYREPVGRYVIHVCDSVICWMNGADSLATHLSRRLGIAMGETTPDGIFTLLPVCCIGYCDRSPAILVNQRVYGPLTPESLDALLEKLKGRARANAPAAETSP